MPPWEHIYTAKTRTELGCIVDLLLRNGLRPVTHTEHPEIGVLDIHMYNGEADRGRKVVLGFLSRP